MPNFIRSYLIAAIIVALTITIRPGNAQTPPSADGSRNPMALLNRYQQAADQLDLTPDQRRQIDGFFKQAIDDLRNAAPDLQNASADEKAAKFREILSDLRDQVGGALNDEQKQTLKDKLQSLRRPTSAPIEPTSQPSLKTSASQPDNRAKTGTALDRLRSGLDQISLTADQKQKVDSLLETMQGEVKQLREQVRGGTVQRSDLKEKLAAILEDTRAKLREILTADQQQHLRSLMQNQSVGSDAPPRPLPNRAASRQPTTAPAHSNTASKVEPSPQLTASPTTQIQAPAPEVGEPAPDFNLRMSNGNAVSLTSNSRHVLVLVFGSYSAPVFRDHAAALSQLREKYSSRGVQFLVVYTKEQHPAGGWEVQRNKVQNISIPPATTLTQRNAMADQMHEQLHLDVPIVVDSMDDATAKAYGVNDTVPAYIIDRSGKIAFRQSWLEMDALQQALDDVLARP
ncbi:MAG: redoxin domain-containing protein [Phycisphaerae bacterium]|nr:redoxin domain-containing protein [Phycisphaerae bacterium]